MDAFMSGQSFVWAHGLGDHQLSAVRGHRASISGSLGGPWDFSKKPLPAAPKSQASHLHMSSKLNAYALLGWL
jgi:hypothetical protein